MNERRATHRAVESIPLYRSLITKRYTYVKYDNGEREFYDRRLDPYQLRNIYKSSDHSRVTALAERLRALKNCAGADCRVAEGFPPP